MEAANGHEESGCVERPTATVYKRCRFRPMLSTLDLLAHLDEMENLISELTRCMGIIEKNHDPSRFKGIDGVWLVVDGYR